LLLVLLEILVEELSRTQHHHSTQLAIDNTTTAPALGVHAIPMLLINMAYATAWWGSMYVGLTPRGQL
jgi:hypothetical protein